MEIAACYDVTVKSVRITSVLFDSLKTSQRRGLWFSSGFAAVEIGESRITVVSHGNDEIAVLGN